MVRLTRIYTRTGDGGETRLAGGQAIDKDDPRIEAYGTVDELSSTLGLARAACVTGRKERGAKQLRQIEDRLDGRLRRIQNELFNLGAELAMLAHDRRLDTPTVRQSHVRRLETEIDEMNGLLRPLESFVLPGGGTLSSQLHVARTVCRRAEREVVRLGRSAPLPKEALRYLNRLSDWLFVAARTAARAHGEHEPLWEPKEA